MHNTTFVHEAAAMLMQKKGLNESKAMSQLPPRHLPAKQPAEAERLSWESDSLGSSNLASGTSGYDLGDRLNLS